MIWMGVIDHHIIGPFFIEGNVNANSYLTLLGDSAVPALDALDLNYGRNEVWYQHDGAPSHSAYAVTDWLDENFEQWIGIRGTIHWPARSPDFNPLDYFVWPYLKSQLYKVKIASMQELRAKIIETTNAITPQMIQNAVDHMEHRVLLCEAAGGNHFENTI